MANTASGSPSLQASPTDPSQDRNATALPNLTIVLRLVTILLTYGRHLAETFDRRAASAGFHLIARHFGTSNTAVILAHIRRGILRAAALHHVLLKRAESGRDLTIPKRRALRRKQPAPPAADADAATPTDADAATPADAAAAAQAAPADAAAAAQANPALAAASAPQPAPRAPKPPPLPAWRDHWLHNAPDPLAPHLQPSFEDLVKQARRDPYGVTLGKIYADLGIAPALSQAPFWNQLFVTMLRYNGSPGYYDLYRWRREQHFEQEQDSRPTMDLSWPPADVGGGRRDILQVMGFLIGEPPVEPPELLPPEPVPWARGAPPAAPRAQRKPTARPAATGPP
jgi:hypothetical protein